MATTRKSTTKKTSTKKTTKKTINLRFETWGDGTYISDRDKYADWGLIAKPEGKIAFIPYGGEYIEWYVDKNSLNSKAVYQILRERSKKENYRLYMKNLGIAFLNVPNKRRKPEDRTPDYIIEARAEYTSHFPYGGVYDQKTHMTFDRFIKSGSWKDWLPGKPKSITQLQVWKNNKDIHEIMRKNGIYSKIDVYWA